MPNTAANDIKNPGDNTTDGFKVATINTAKAHNLCDIGLLFINMANNTNDVITNALMQETLCPEIKK